MEKRKFNANRLYKLIKLLVIGIAILSGILGLITFNGIQTNYTDNKISKYCSTYDKKFIEECKFSYYSTKWEFEGNIMKEFGLAFVLPLLFFGGVGLYRYLFPKANKKD